MVYDNGGDGGGDFPWPWSIRLMPLRIDELLGKKVRVVLPEGFITQEYQPERVTIYITDNQSIYDIHLEPPLKQNLMDVAEKLKVSGPGDDPVPFPHSPLSKANGPTLIHELLGRIVRIIHKEDKITEERLPGRVNIYITEDHRISNIEIEQNNITE